MWPKSRSRRPESRHRGNAAEMMSGVFVWHVDCRPPERRNAQCPVPAEPVGVNRNIHFCRVMCQSSNDDRTDANRPARERRSLATGRSAHDRRFGGRARDALASVELSRLRRHRPDNETRRWALSDPHVSHPPNRERLGDLPARPDGPGLCLLFGRYAEGSASATGRPACARGRRHRRLPPFP